MDDRRWCLPLLLFVFYVGFELIGRIKTQITRIRQDYTGYKQNPRNLCY